MNGAAMEQLNEQGDWGSSQVLDKVVSFALKAKAHL
jgi:hypothetical protein